MDVLGIDIGFGFTKATNGKEFMMFKSILGEATEIQFRSDFGNNSFANNLHVTVDGKSFFIGDFAEQQSIDRRFTLDQERLLSEFVKILALTVAGRFQEKDEPLNIVSGLPVGFFKNNHKRFAQILNGQHKITYHKPDGSEVTKNIEIKKVRMMPQPLGSFFNLLMNEKGKIVNMELTKQKVGVVDIGFRTTDFTIFDKLRYIDRGSSTLDVGISKSFNIIATKLREKSGLNVELYRLYKAAQNGSIKMRGQEYNFSEIRDQIYVQLANSIANEVNRLWVDDWDIDMVILTGGGCMELAKYIHSLIAGEVIPIEKNTDTRLNNVQGYLKYGRYIWGESGLCTIPPPLPEERTKK